MLIRKNDNVVLLKDITSCRNAEGSVVSDRGQRTRVLATFPKDEKVLLQHTNYRWKHVRPDRDNPRGGRVQREAPVHVSNVALWCEECQRGVRARVERGPEGRVRRCAKCNAVIPVVL
jgi:large subunit ribosomal protein L24